MKKRKPKLTWSRQQKWQLKMGINYTLNRDLAIATAVTTGKAPIEYIHPRNRETYLRAYPELAQKIQ